MVEPIAVSAVIFTLDSEFESQPRSLVSDDCLKLIIHYLKPESRTHDSHNKVENHKLGALGFVTSPFSYKTDRLGRKSVDERLQEFHLLRSCVLPSC